MRVLGLIRGASGAFAALIVTVAVVGHPAMARPENCPSTSGLPCRLCERTLSIGPPRGWLKNFPVRSRKR